MIGALAGLAHLIEENREMHRRAESDRIKPHMKIEINRIKTYTIEEFAITNDLTMVVDERRWMKDSGVNTYHAGFKGVEIKEGRFLSSASGMGVTVNEAIDEYASAISFKKIVVNALRDDRREIHVPKLVRGGNYI